MFDQLVPRIPLIEAADFFHRIKHAGWEEPANQDGALEGQFAAPIEQVLQQITTVVTAKFRIMVAYYTYAESMRDLAQHPIGEVFHEHAGHELAAAEYYLKRAAVLGGAIHLEPIEPPPASTDPIHIIQTMVRAEQEAIANQRHLRELVGDDNPMRIEIEEKLAQDQHHLDELWQMLPSELHEGVEGNAAPVVEAPGQGDGAALPVAPPAGPAAGEGPVAKTAGLKSELARAAHPERKAEGLARFGELLTGARAKRLKDAAGKAQQDIKGLKGAAELARQDALKAARGSRVGALEGQVVGHENAAAKLDDKAKQYHRELHGQGRRDPGERNKVTLTRVATGAAAVGALKSYAGHRKEAADKAAPTDAELKETGRQRAVTQLAGEAHRERGRRGERFGETVGRALGAAGGAALAGKRSGLGGLALGTVGGYALGGKLGKEIGTETDIKKNASAMRFKLASIKLGFGPDLGTYMAANQAGQQAQEQSEADFYREKVRSMEQASGASQQQIADMQAQLQQLQEQTAQSGAAIQAAGQEASMARDDALAQTQAAASMRIGYQKLRQAIIDTASQDPEAMAGGLPGDLPPGSGNGIAPAMQPGMPGASPEAVAPGAAPAEAGGPGAPGDVQNAAGKPPGPGPTAQPSSALKTAGIRDIGKKALEAGKKAVNHPRAGLASVAAGGAAGGAAGAAKGVKDDDKHPVRSGLQGGLKGAVLGGAIAGGTHRLARNLSSL